MTQNINLLAEITLQPISALNVKLMLKIIATWLALLALIYAIALMTNHSRQNNLNTLEKTQKELSNKIEDYYKKFPELKAKSDGTLQPTPTISPNTIGFYQQLEELSQITPHGLWLSYILISEMDNSAVLKGQTIVSSTISTFINSLNKSISFSNKKFDTWQLKDDPNSNNKNFVISTNPINSVEATKKP